MPKPLKGYIPLGGQRDFVGVTTLKILRQVKQWNHSGPCKRQEDQRKDIRTKVKGEKMLHCWL